MPMIVRVVEILCVDQARNAPLLANQYVKGLLATSRKAIRAIKDITTINLAKELDINIVKATNPVDRPAKENSVSQHLDSFDAAFVVNANSSREWAHITSTGKSFGKEIILDFGQSTIRLASSERDLEKALLKPRRVRDDLYGCLFQQLGSVETQGESSGASAESCVRPHNINAALNASCQRFLLTTACTTGFKPTVSDNVGVPASMSSKRVHYDISHGTLPAEGEPYFRSVRKQCQGCSLNFLSIHGAGLENSVGIENPDGTLQGVEARSGCQDAVGSRAYTGSNISPSTSAVTYKMMQCFIVIQKVCGIRMPTPVTHNVQPPVQPQFSALGSQVGENGRLMTESPVHIVKRLAPTHCTSTNVVTPVDGDYLQGEGLGKTSLTGVPISKDFQALKKCGKLSRLLEMKKINKLSLAHTRFTWISLHTFGYIPNSP
ncbi:hypothetical protein Tco_0590281 [Tanacetum coccineum]